MSRDLASVFLGPKAENADAFEKLLLDALRDHVYWRRNFHPEDGFTVSEREKRRPEYEESLAKLTQELWGLLGELKGGVPFFSPRYIGHMSSDLTLASLAGYFAGMLYNPNNVAAEASPVTTRLELQVGADLAAMIGYPAGHFSHLTSGGTIANFEALAIARNIKYVPVAVQAAAAQLSVSVPVQLPEGAADVRSLDLWRLLNVPARAALDLVDAFGAAVGDRRRAHEAIQEHSLAGMGFQAFGARLLQQFAKTLPPAVVLVPSTAHYSWQKICRALGVGGQQVVRVPVDDHFRMSPDALWHTLQALAGRHQAVIATVSVAGTTEESAVDRLDVVAEVKRRAERELGLCFTWHADAAWGGYAASITRGPGGARRPYGEALADAAPEAWPDEGVYRALCALEQTDSITIDPHKLGFVPYPAGAVCFRDGRVKDQVSVEAPYVFVEDRVDLGRYIFEGSKPGAAAAGVWLSHRVLPLDASGYGHLITETARGARRLFRAVSEADWSPFRVVLLPPSDLNIVCFAFAHPALRSLDAANALVERVHREMSAGGPRSARELDYFVSKTVLRASEYGDAVHPLIRALGFQPADYERAGGLAVLRCTVMDPFIGTNRGANFVEGFVRAVRTVVAAQLPGAVSPRG